MGFHPRPQPRLSLGRVLLAGLAVLAFVKLMSAVNRSNRSKATTIVLGVLLVAAGAIVMSFRRSATRARW